LGASTGGPGALVEILQTLPLTFRVPLLIVLHINEPFGTAFAEWLDGQSALRVRYATDGEPLAAVGGRVVMAPPDRHLVVRDGRLRLTHDPERNSCRPSVDVLFESLAQEYGSSAAACVLTGMGRDGAAGLLAIRRAGGLTIAQDEATSVVYGMPQEAARLGAASRVLPLPEIGGVIASLSTGLSEKLP
jgi:two-component system chemotaxis response regulator CheB